LYVYIPYNRGYKVYIQARPLEWGPVAAFMKPSAPFRGVIRIIN